MNNWLYVCRRLIAGLTFAMLSTRLLLAAPASVGSWDFDDSQNLLKASVGSNLILHGSHQAITGPSTNNGAVRIGVGSYYECAHGIAAGTYSYVNRYSLLFDFRIASIGSWYCFFQTQTANGNDGDCFIRNSDGAIGVAQTGYSPTPASPGVWQRLVVTVDNASGIYRLYLDGQQILLGSAQAVDGRFSLDSTLLLFADDNGEDGTMDVAQVAIYDACLTAAEVAELGGVPTGPAQGLPPVVTSAGTNAVPAATGQSAEYVITATDPDGDMVQIEVDWGDGGELSTWDTLAASGSEHRFSHTYRLPGSYAVRVLARDAGGLAGTWTQVCTVNVTGEAVIQFLTRPYLQNLQTNAITILWEQDFAATATVEFSTDDSYTESAACEHATSQGNTEIYRCPLAGLTPGTTYQYRLRVGGKVGPGGSFTTAPASAADFSFGVWSDSQGSNHGTYSADPMEPTRSMFLHMATNHLAFAVTCGDLAESGGSYSDVRQYYLDRVAAGLGPAIPWFVAWGNHDGGSSTVIRQFADFPSQQRAGYGPGYGSYSFDYAGCHFVCIDNSCQWTDITSWLQQDLQSAANLNARFTFLFIHVPPYCEIWLDGDSWLRANLVPLLETYGVDVCFSGHTHEYERGQLNDVFYCITGGGSWLDFPETQVHDWPHMTVGGCSSVPGVTRPRSDAGGGLINEYVRVDVRSNTFTASMVAFNPDGTELGVLDQFSGTLPVETVQPPVLYRENFESTAELSLPTGWTATHHTSVDVDSSDAGNPRSNVYLTWTVVSSNRLAQVFGADRLLLPGMVDGRSLYAESDHRSGSQIQFVTTPDIAVSGATNVEVSFLSNYMQNQNSMGALEYSVDHGQTWWPAIYLLDSADVIVVTNSSTVDGLATFTRIDPDGVPTADGQAASSGTYGEHILSRPFESLGSFVSARTNDDTSESRRRERLRLAHADGQISVRFRFALVGSASWFWGVDNFEVLGYPVPLVITGCTRVPEGLRLDWTGPAGPYQLQHRARLTEGSWENTGSVLDATTQSVVVPATESTGFFRLQLAR